MKSLCEHQFVHVEGLMLKSHPQLFCSPGSTNPQPRKDRDGLVREGERCVQMPLRGWGSSLNTSDAQRDTANTAATSTQRLLVRWAERLATSPSLSPSWISHDNEPNTIFDPLWSSAWSERPGIPCLHRDNYLCSQKSLWTQNKKSNTDKNGLHRSEKSYLQPSP